MLTSLDKSLDKTLMKINKRLGPSASAQNEGYTLDGCDSFYSIKEYVNQKQNPLRDWKILNHNNASRKNTSGFGKTPDQGTVYTFVIYDDRFYDEDFSGGGFSIQEIKSVDPKVGEDRPPTNRPPTFSSAENRPSTFSSAESIVQYLDSVFHKRQ